MLGSVLAAFAVWCTPGATRESRFGAICAPRVAWSSGGFVAASAPLRQSVARISRSVHLDIRKIILISPRERASSECILRSAVFLHASARPKLDESSPGTAVR